MNKAEEFYRKKNYKIGKQLTDMDYEQIAIMESYAEQESREVAVKWRTESVISDKDSYYEILEESYKLYDDWKSKQEEKP